MGYLHIDNLYKNQKILEFKECFVLEKIHGTSAHVSFKAADQSIHFFHGGEKRELFLRCFDAEKLLQIYKENFTEDLIIFGEAYGGKMQAMSDIYGKENKFIAFDVKLNNKWLTVPHAENICKKFGLEFVWYTKINADVEVINKHRDAFSEQAKRNGCGDNKLGEGVILKTVNLYFDERGERIIAKHKRDEFRETKERRQIDPEKLKIISEAKEVAEEWVTEMRLEHILGKIPEDDENKYSVKNIGNICSLMVEDIIREAVEEIVFSDLADREIRKATATLYKEKIKKVTGQMMK